MPFPRRPLSPDAVWLVAVALVQAGLCVVAFNKPLRHPGSHLLYAEYDGIKNYFTPASYVTGFARPPDADAWKVYGQHYPFGEYLFYADATPAVALVGRAAARAGVPMAGAGTGYFTYVLVGFQWAVAVVLFLLLRQWLRTRWLAALFAVALVWTCKQYWHLLIGSFNLGLTVFTVGFVAWLWRIHLRPRAWWPWLAAAGWIGAASWFHLYYLIVFGTALAVFAAVQLAWAWRVDGRAAAVAVALRAGASGALAIALIYLPILLVDDKLALRTGEELGYNFHAWRLDVRSLITPRPGLRERFLVSYDRQFFGEDYGYLGLWWWWAMILLAGLATWRGWTVAAVEVRAALRTDAATRFFAVFGIAGAACFFASLGTDYQLPGGEWRWEVVLNPFYFLVDHSVTLQQFRAIARFFFVTQWAWWLPVLYALDVVWRRGGWPRVLVLVVALCAVLDTRDALRITNRQHPTNPLGNAMTSPVRAALPAGLTDTYQALLVAPYFHVGSQAAGLVADPVTAQEQVDAFWLAASTGLPLLNAVTSRTPPHEAAALFEFAARGTARDSLADLLDGRPVLVAVHRDLTALLRAGSFDQLTLPPPGAARESVLASASIAQRVGVTPVGTYGPYDFYRWDWRAAAPNAD